MERPLDPDNITGIIGGSGPDATSLLYDKIIEQARKVYGARHLDDYPNLVLYSASIKQNIRDNTNDLQDVQDTLCNAADRLKAAGAKQLCFACNTHHLSLDLVRDHVGLPFISMIELVSKKIKEENYKSIAVIGTSYTLGQNLYQLTNLGIEVVKLDDHLMEESHLLIQDALAEIPDSLTPKYVDFVKKICDLYKFDALLLGCTEYSVLEYKRQLSGLERLPIEIVDPLSELAIAIAKKYYLNQ